MPAQLSGRHEGYRKTVNKNNLTLRPAFHDLVMLSIQQCFIAFIVNVSGLAGHRCHGWFRYGKGNDLLPATGQRHDKG